MKTLVWRGGSKLRNCVTAPIDVWPSSVKYALPTCILLLPETNKTADHSLAAYSPNLPISFSKLLIAGSFLNQVYLSSPKYYFQITHTIYVDVKSLGRERQLRCTSSRYGGAVEVWHYHIDRLKEITFKEITFLCILNLLHMCQYIYSLFEICDSSLDPVWCIWGYACRNGCLDHGSFTRTNLNCIHTLIGCQIQWGIMFM